MKGIVGEEYISGYSIEDNNLKLRISNGKELVFSIPSNKEKKELEKEIQDNQFKFFKEHQETSEKELKGIVSLSSLGALVVPIIWIILKVILSKEMLLFDILTAILSLLEVTNISLLVTKLPKFITLKKEQKLLSRIEDNTLNNEILDNPNIAKVLPLDKVKELKESTPNFNMSSIDSLSFIEANNLIKAVDENNLYRDTYKLEDIKEVEEKKKVLTLGKFKGNR